MSQGNIAYPVVTDFKAVMPIATLYSAVEVVLEGLLPRYIESSSTSASERSLILLTVEPCSDERLTVSLEPPDIPMVSVVPLRPDPEMD